MEKRELVNTEDDIHVTKDFNLENVEFATKKTQHDNNQDFGNCKQTNNNRQIVYVGIIIVLLTTYLGVSNLPKCLVSCVENISIAEHVQQQRVEILSYLQQTEKLEKTKILERLLEYKDICQDLEIFTKQQLQEKEQGEQKHENHKDNINDVIKNIGEGSGDGIEQGTSVEEDESSGSAVNGDCGKANRNKGKKSKYSIKATSTKNGFNKHNKSTKAKYQKNLKKDLNLNKKNSTAEPIIYLFALVFIYLLLKAASDINQHYKSQNKNDKRLRRCSLQSYAQVHRPDRRASKELALKQKQQQLQQRIESLSRTSSKDQQIYNYDHHHQQQQHLIDGSTQKSAKLKQQATAGISVRSNVSYSSNWQLLRQHTTTQSIDNSDILNTKETSTPLMARRCSVPAALSYQKQKLPNTSPLNSIANEHVNMNVSFSRRSSIVPSVLYLSMDPNDSLIPETKRRVRMINRH